MTHSTWESIKAQRATAHIFLDPPLATVEETKKAFERALLVVKVQR